MVGTSLKEATPDKNAAPVYLFKVCLIGGSMTGKTAALMNFTDKRFDETHTLTIGVDFAIKLVETGGGDLVKLQIWDTAGQERFRTITNSYYRGSHGIVIFYDMTDHDSFENVPHWKMEIERYASEDISIIVAGTKSDLEDKRAVTAEEISEMSKEHGLEFVEISAKTGDNVSKMFEVLVNKMIWAKKEYTSTKHSTAMSTMVGPLKKKGNKKQSNTNVKTDGNAKSKTCTIL